MGDPADVAWGTTERDAVYRQIMERGWNPEIGAFIQQISARPSTWTTSSTAAPGSIG